MNISYIISVKKRMLKTKVGGNFMTNIVLIHGTWCDGSVWGEFVNELEKLGLNVYTPTLRYHDLPYEEVEKKVAEVSLDEFTDDIVELIETLDETPIVLGHSLGGLLAQKVAMRTKVKGLVLMGTAPAAGIFAFYPSMVICFYKHFLRWGFWKKSMPPYKHAFYDYCMNNQDEADKEREFSKLVPESGFTYFQMALPFLDKQKGAYIDFEKVSEPVLVITGSEDKMVHPNIAKATAKKYKNSTLSIIEGSDHMYEAPKYRDKTVEIIDQWLKNIINKEL